MSNIYMIIEGIKGNVSTEGYQNAIALHSFNLGAERLIKTPVGKGAHRETAIPVFLEIVVTKALDNASNVLFQYFCRAQNIPLVQIVCCSTDAVPEAYVKYMLKNVMISHCSHDIYAGGKPFESLSLNYTALQIAVIGRDASNKPQPQTLAGYDLATTEVS
jgi:type VI secretion system secreted protein Hcp